MICPNWDDLYPPYGNGIWYLYEPDSHRFVIEWDSVHYFSPNTQWDKFEIIVYDTTIRTYTGDNEIIFQYLTANNYISNTVGLEDETNTIGINALCNNVYHRACAPIVLGRAIKSTTDTVALIGIAEKTGNRLLDPKVWYSSINRKGVDFIFPAPRERPLSLSIYDLNGREVRNFTVSPYEKNLYWDLRDSKGNLVPTGLYFVRLGGRGRSLKLVLVR